MKLNLTANNTAEERIKEYLEQNVSVALAEKINFGTPITKDGKQLINRKTLDGFMKYATEEARKLATKGAQFACIDDATVFGWSIHYFEEEAIEGELFNLDGTPYKKIITPKSKEEKKAPKQTPTQTPEKAPQKPKADTPKQTPTETKKTAQSAKSAVVLPTPGTKPTEAYQSLPKPTEKQKPTDTDQMSIFDLF